MATRCFLLCLFVSVHMCVGGLGEAEDDIFLLQAQKRVFWSRRRRRRAPPPPPPPHTVTTRRGNALCKRGPGNLPRFFALTCSQTVTSAKLFAKVENTGLIPSKLRVYVDGVEKQSWPLILKGLFGTLWYDKSIFLGNVLPGRHVVKYVGDTLKVENVKFQWVGNTGAKCSWGGDSYDQGSFTNLGLDTLNGLFNTPTVFDESRKKDLHSAFTLLGTNLDGTINAAAVTNGFFEWIIRYSHTDGRVNTTDGHSDTWHSSTNMYEEASLDSANTTVNLVRGLEAFGSEISIREPCDTVSNWAFLEAAAWVPCSGMRFDRDESASIITNLGALAGSSAFFHGSGTRLGQYADAVIMKLMMYQTHQILIKTALGISSITDEKKHMVLHLTHTDEYDSGIATERAKDLTSLFAQPYDEWESALLALDRTLPPYDLTIAAIIVETLWILKKNSLLPFVKLVWTHDLQDLLLGALGETDGAWINGEFTTVIKEVADSVDICAGASRDIFNSLLKFIATFVEAVLYQEQIIPLKTKKLTDILQWLPTMTNLLSDMPGDWDYYNGAKSQCQKTVQHSVWHESSAHGLIHLLHVADKMNAKVVSNMFWTHKCF